MRIKELFENNIVSPSGIGAVPYNNNVNHVGVKVMMKPLTFLKLATTLNGHGGENTDYLVDQLMKGKPLGNPFLDVIVPTDEMRGNGIWQVSNHEGRHRMNAIYQVHGDIPVEVHLFFRYGYKNSDITPDWLAIRDVRNQQGNMVVRNAIERFIK